MDRAQAWSDNMTSFSRLIDELENVVYDDTKTQTTEEEDFAKTKVREGQNNLGWF